MKKIGFYFILTLGIVLTIFLGFSYSMWVMTNSQDSLSVIETTNKCFDVELTSESDNIKLENAYPITDEAGSKLVPYSFKITNTCEWNVYYSVNLETLNKSSIDSKFMKISLDNSNAKKLSEYEKTDKVLADSKESVTLITGYLPVDGSISFDLRIWLDYDTTVDDIKNDGTDKWSGKVVVVSNLVEDKEILAACQSKGGDLIDDGECRKYYVKLNQQFNPKNVFASKYNYIVDDESNNSFTLSGGDYTSRFSPITSYVINDLYFIRFSASMSNAFSSSRKNDSESYPEKASPYSRRKGSYYFYDFSSGFNSYIIITDIDLWSAWYFELNNLSFFNYITIDLTLMFGDGNEPDKEWCDKYLTNYFEYNSEGTLTPIKEIGEPIKTSYYDTISLVN